jgi:phage I-like protein
MKIIICTELTGVPAEIQVIPWGYHKTDKGDFLCDEASVALVMEDFRSRQNDMVIDYEHQTLTGAEAPAAGWIKELTDKGHEGLWAKVQWTDKARAYINNKEYRYLSPVFLKDTKDNRVIKLINAALTNQPAIDGMVPLFNKEAEAEHRVCPKKTEVKQMKRVYEALGLGDGAAEEEVIKQIEALKGHETVAHKEVLEALGLKTEATVSEVKATVLAMKQSHGSVESLTKEVLALKEMMSKQEAEATVTMAMSQGKIMPAQRDWAMEYATKDPDGFKMFAAKAPELIPLKDVTGGAAANKDYVVIDEAQRMVNKQLGISDEAWQKNKNAAGANGVCTVAKEVQ